MEILGEASPHRAGNSGRLSAECCWFMERLTRTSWAQAKQCCDWIDRNTDLRNSQTGWTLGVARDTFARNFCSSFGIALLRKESFLGGLLNSYPIPGSLHRTQVFCSTPSILVWVVEWQDPTSASQNRVLWIFLVSGFAILLYESFHQVSLKKTFTNWKVRLVPGFAVMIVKQAVNGGSCCLNSTPQPSPGANWKFPKLQVGNHVNHN